MEKYPIGNLHERYNHRGDLDGTDLSNNVDMQAHYRVGYNEEANLLYVAVEVVDDDIVVGNHQSSTDACEIWVYGGEGSTSFSHHYLPMYSMVPGYGRPGPQYDANPGLINRSISQTFTKGAHSRTGNVTVYEWAVEVFDSFPDRPVYLTPGRRIPFDVAVVDKDNNGYSPAWVYWAPGGWTGGEIGGHLGTLAIGEAVPVQARMTDPVLGAIPQRGESAISQQHVDTIIGGITAVVIILSIGLAGYFILRGRSAANNGTLEGLAGRLENIERRMTDTQEVMIALSEKYDLLEEKYQHLAQGEEEV